MAPTPPTPPYTRLRCDLGVAEAVGQVIIWLLLSLVTFGLALFFFPYYFARLVVGRTVMVDAGGTVRGRLRSDIGFGMALGHAVIWLLLTIITLGLAYFVYLYRVWKIVIDQIEVTPV
jgi:hypothetical protein